MWGWTMGKDETLGATIWEIPDHLWEQIHPVILDMDPPKSTGRKRADPRRMLGRGLVSLGQAARAPAHLRRMLSGLPVEPSAPGTGSARAWTTQWSDHAIARTTPITLFSWTTQRSLDAGTTAHGTDAKPSPTFVDAIALVRRHLWLASDHCPTQNRIYGKSRLPCTTDL